MKFGPCGEKKSYFFPANYLKFGIIVFGLCLFFWNSSQIGFAYRTLKNHSSDVICIWFELGFAEQRLGLSGEEHEMRTMRQLRYKAVKKTVWRGEGRMRNRQGKLRLLREHASIKCMEMKWESLFLCCHKYLWKKLVKCPFLSSTNTDWEWQCKIAVHYSIS